MQQSQDVWTHFRDQLMETSSLEWLGTITGLICVYLAARQKMANWPVSIISVICYGILFFEHRLYGDAVLQLYFLSTAVYGWYYWSSKEYDKKTPLITSLTVKTSILTIIGTVAMSIALGLFLRYFTNSDVPYLDGICTAISFIAQYLMSRKVLQNWLLWILVDAVYIPLYLYKQLVLTAMLYLIFFIIAIIGFIDWKNTWKKQIKY